jgi:hypothetical protein
MTGWRVAVAIVLVAGLRPALALAQQQSAQRPKCADQAEDQSATKSKTKYEVVTGPDGKKVFRIKTGFIICGKVPKPDVLYGLLNSNINYEWETLKQDFLPKVEQSVEHPPF